MRVLGLLKRYSPVVAVGLALYSVNAHAQLDGSGVLDTVLNDYKNAAASWGTAITSAANWMFWTLVAISMVWTFGFMALRKADIGEFFAEFLRFTIFTGFFNWLLKNGSSFATDIINSLRQLGTTAGGMAGVSSPSSIVDVGFSIFSRVIDASSFWSPVQSGCGILIAAVILVVLALVAVNMLRAIITGWVLSFAGVFFLGFGGSRWTSDMALGYFKTVLGIGVQLMAMVLLVAVGQTIINSYYSKIGSLDLKDMGVMLVASAALLSLVTTIPGQLAGMVGGGAAMGGGAGAGTALAAAGIGAAALATGGAVAAAGLKNMAGGAQAVMAAVSKASENMASGTGMFSGSGIGASGSGSTGAGSVASAMGGGGSDASPVPSTGGGGDKGGSSSGGSGESGGASSGGESSAGQSASTDAGSGSEGGSGGGSNAESGSSGSSGGESSGGESSGGGSSGGGSSGGGSGPGQSGSSGSGGGSGKTPSAARQMASVVGRFGADVANNLAKGSMAVAKDKASSALAAAGMSINQTIGGQIADKISGKSAAAAAANSAASAAPSFGQNSLAGAGETSVDKAAEKAAFAKRNAA